MDPEKNPIRATPGEGGCRRKHPGAGCPVCNEWHLAYWCDVCQQKVSEKRCPLCGLKARKMR